MQVGMSASGTLKRVMRLICLVVEDMVIRVLLLLLAVLKRSFGIEESCVKFLIG